MQNNTYNSGVMCSTMQNLQVVNNAASANCQQLTQQHTITMSLYQFDLIYGPSTDRIDRPATRSPWCLVLVTAPRVQTGRPCRTLCQSAIWPSFWHSPCWAPPAALTFGSHRPQSRHGVTQSQLQRCPHLTCSACRPLRLAWLSSLPTAQWPSYGRSRSLTG